ncbi:MAG: DedA family protein [Proteobacteria bacterium]|nr:DedA family protein [Pseudomonadota bacterium]
MTLESLWGTVTEVVKANIAYAEPVVFFLGFGEGIPGLSLLLPSSMLFLAIGGMHSAAGGHFWHLWLAGALGAVVGDCVTYSIGRYFRGNVAHLPYFVGRPTALASAHALLERWGWLAVLVGKFTGFARPFIPIVAGIVEMPFAIFFVASILSSLAWAGVFLAPGYGFNFFFD